MLYQLPDGRTVEISIHDYLSFTDEELQGLVGYTHIGVEINSPSYGSSITKPGRSEPDDDNYTDHEIPDVPSDEKFKDQDYSIEDE